MESLVLPVLFLSFFADPVQGQSETERRELAEIRLLVTADRKLPEARDRLTALLASLEPRREADPGVNEFATEVAELASEVARALGLAPAGETQDKVDQAVLNALANRDWDFIRQLGKLAAPGLAQAVRKDPDQLPREDPLFNLMQCNPLAGSRLVEEFLGFDGFFWKWRVIHAIAEADPLASDEVWTAGEPRRCLADGLVRVIEKYIEDPDVGDHVLRFLDPFQEYGLTPTMREALLRALRSPSAVRRKIAWEELFTKEWLQPVLEGMLGDEDPDLRVRAAGKLRKYPGSTALLGHADDPVPDVRWSVAKLLEDVDPESWSTSGRAALQRLAADADENVRHLALRLLDKLPKIERYAAFEAGDLFDPDHTPRFARMLVKEPLPDESYRALAASEDPEVRRALASDLALALPAPLALELLERLAHDPVRRVAEVIVHGAKQLWWEDPAAALRVIGVLLENPSLPRHVTVERLPELFGSFKVSRSATAILVGWAVESGDPELVRVVDVKDREFAFLAPDLARDLCVRLFDVYQAKAIRFMADYDVLNPAQARALRSVAVDGSRPAALRVLAALAAVRHEEPDEEWRQAVRSILSDPSWRAPGESYEWSSKKLSHLVARLPGDVRNELILGFLRDPELPVSLFGASIEAFSEDSARAPEVVRAIIDRWYDSTDGQGLVTSVLKTMGNWPRLADRDVLSRAARDPRYASVALRTIGGLRDPSYLPVIESILRESGNFGLISKAVEALSGHLSDEAAELLLVAAAKLPAGELRDGCLAQLEKIREYQDARSRWAARKVQAQTREQVVAELLKLLDAKETEKRVQAIRGLATWEAVETMPRLIQLLSDSNKDVAAAAREALARLNVPKGE